MTVPDPPSPAAAGRQGKPGVIARADLLRYHRAGPQVFIQRVRVKATFRRGKFFGWRVLAYAGPGQLRQGDIVTRVNGGAVERPDQFMKLWEQLPRRDELVVELVRERKRVTLRYAIVD